MTLTANDKLTLSKIWEDIEAMHQEVQDIYMGQRHHAEQHMMLMQSPAAYRARQLARVMEALRMAADEIVELKDKQDAET